MVCETFVSYYFCNARYYKNYDKIISFRLNDINNTSQSMMKSTNNTSDVYDEKYDKFTMKSFPCVNTNGII